MRDVTRWRGSIGTLPAAAAVARDVRRSPMLACMLRFPGHRQASQERKETRLSKIESVLHETRQFAPPAALE
ncbi:hypothetical protein, partial [Burkholderia aenigmatica]|uniref:hypothetical protein n=1 Tax=Burkholderia aenigmatica TaxID=2015348 RepID=UPI001C2E8E83